MTELRAAGCQEAVSETGLSKLDSLKIKLLKGDLMSKSCGLKESLPKKCQLRAEFL